MHFEFFYNQKKNKQIVRVFFFTLKITLEVSTLFFPERRPSGKFFQKGKKLSLFGFSKHQNYLFLDLLFYSFEYSFLYFSKHFSNFIFLPFLSFCQKINWNSFKKKFFILFGIFKIMVKIKNFKKKKKKNFKILFSRSQI